ncbi:hypothetical protein [Singulisphaera acidiphila]|uniref:Uncharacterized protein n=1 Tax=Singulisphaera acidiphila (strain ATCC BAA-1392 / DSM 18658 / VKM B-2454 / MOB10) TaxID=886293 RepID=L0DBA9_SINAD|nr:hypothetical protein [Singulisphaera acidiphila]AGA26527.1 hypothetical protein Sinac_2207 [Singulisphaera acidiphila DSM 18658]
MATLNTPRRKLKPLVTDLDGLATLLNTDRNGVLKALHAGELPTPRVVCGIEVWLIAEIKAWLAAGSPDRATWELRKTAPKAKRTRKMIPKQSTFRFNNFQVPRAGKGVYSWAREMEKAFQTRLIPGMMRDGEELGWGKIFNAWDQQQVDLICMRAIEHLTGLPNYGGQFGHLFEARDGEPPW